MRRAPLPISALLAWSKLNDVDFLDTAVQDLGSRGFGLVTTRALSSEDVSDMPTLLIIPHDLILGAVSVEEFAKVDQHFRQLLAVAGGTVCIFPAERLPPFYGSMRMVADEVY